MTFMLELRRNIDMKKTLRPLVKLLVWLTEISRSLFSGGMMKYFTKVSFIEMRILKKRLRRYFRNGCFCGILISETT